MSAWDWAVVAAVCALTVIVIRHLNPAADGEADDRAAWQASTQADVQRDLADLRATRQAFADIVAIEYPAHIPHQTRRTEDNQ